MCYFEKQNIMEKLTEKKKLLTNNKILYSIEFFLNCKKDKEYKKEMTERLNIFVTCTFILLCKVLFDIPILSAMKIKSKN